MMNTGDFSNWLLCIFSFNRGFLLRNLIESIESFYPDMQVCVFDDGSTDESTLQVLSELKEKGCHIHEHTFANGGSGKHGHLYDIMNIALDHAFARLNIEYLYFIQDDMQFLWRDEQLNERAKEVFSRTECLMCNFNFLLKILKSGLETRLPKVEPGLFSLAERAVADTGVISVEKARQAGLNFPFHSESINGTHWYKKGYRFYWHPVAHLAWTPWPPTYRRRNSKNFIQGYPLKPLSPTSIQKIRANKSYALLEDYTSSMHFLPKPYWHEAKPSMASLLKIYTKYYLGKRL